MYRKFDYIRILLLKKISKIALFAARAVTFSQTSGSAMYQPLVTDEIRDRIGDACCQGLSERH